MSGQVATARNVVAATLFAILMIAHAFALLHFRQAFPSSWSWYELLVNYQGGFTKRGLLGATAYWIRHVVSPMWLLTCMIGAAYVIVSAVLLFRFRMAERLSGILFVVSPLGWLFALLVPAAYGRKDVFVVLAVTASLALASRLRHPIAFLAISAAVFAVGGLTVEIAWLYYPLVLSAWTFRHREASSRDRLIVLGGGWAYVTLCLGLTLRIGHVDTAAISASWLPIAMPDGGGSALCCINFSVGTAMATARTALPNAGGYAMAEAFGLIPLTLLLWERRGYFVVRHKRMIRSSASLRPKISRDCTDCEHSEGAPSECAGAPGGRLAWIGLCSGTVIALAPLATAADWGRYLYLWTACTFVAMWIASRSDETAAEPAWWQAEALPKLLFAIVYATTWQTVHYQFPDRAAFIPGLASRAIGVSTIAPFTQ